MNLRDVKYLIAVAETRHFGHAAERCFVSQPTLSGQIKKLEDELGVIVFERTNRSVTVTPIGERILTHARLLLEQAQAIQQVAQMHRDPLAGTLRIGIIPTLSPYLLPLVLAPLRKRYPHLKLILSEELTEGLIKRLRNHEIDAALLATPANDGDLVAIPLFDEPFWLAAPRAHSLQDKANITLGDLDEIDLLLLSDGHCLTAQVIDVCRKAAQRQQKGEMANLRAASLETLLHLVGAGFGCTLVPALAAHGARMIGGDILVRPLEPPGALRQIRLVYRGSYPRQPVLAALSEIILLHLPDTVRVIKGSQ